VFSRSLQEPWWLWSTIPGAVIVAGIYGAHQLRRAPAGDSDR
jgi:hypothetical protein